MHCTVCGGSHKLQTSTSKLHGRVRLVKCPAVQGLWALGVTREYTGDTADGGMAFFTLDERDGKIVRVEGVA